MKYLIKYFKKMAHLFEVRELADFAAEYGFGHTTSSPCFPQSNVKVENAVKTASLIKSTKQSN